MDAKEIVPVKARFAFFTGSIFGLILGVFVGGIAAIGQGVWETGRYWGHQQCNMEQIK